MVVAFAVVLWTVFFLRGYLSRQDKVVYSAAYNQVGLLKRGDLVTVAGVPVGRVQSIGLEGKQAVVLFTVLSEIGITKNSRAFIDASDVFGEAYLQLDILEGEPAPPGSRIAGELAPGLRDLIKEGVEVVKRSNLLLDQARVLIGRIDTMLAPESSVSRTLDNVERITENTRDFSERFDTYGDLLERTMASLDSAAVGIRTAVDSSAGDVTTVLNSLESASSRLDSLLLAVENGRGTLGRLMKDENLYQDLRNTTLETRNLIREIREQPGKFLKISPF